MPERVVRGHALGDALVQLGVDQVVPVDELLCLRLQYGGDLAQHFEPGSSPVALPLRDQIAGHVESGRKLLLREVLCFS